MRDFLNDPIRESITIAAPMERCFSLSTRLELVKRTLGMNLVDSGRPGEVSSGHVVAGSRVHWSGWKFGLPTEHHTLITGFTAPHHDREQGNETAWFQDSQEQGRFAFFQHDHHFREAIDPATNKPSTELEDEVRFTLPFGIFGRLAAQYLLAPHIVKLARQRFAMIRQLAEGEGWREWVDESESSTSR